MGELVEYVFSGEINMDGRERGIAGFDDVDIGVGSLVE